ncbi:MAG TPA: hypothetical protein VE713_05400, partial [Pyrinomonadaceae bacterium]|nr:hypothetical protein [Pyrinomonadaceae bacterium]
MNDRVCWNCGHLHEYHTIAGGCSFAREGGAEILIVVIGPVLPSVEGAPPLPAVETLLQFQTVNNPRSP